MCQNRDGFLGFFIWIAWRIFGRLFRLHFRSQIKSISFAESSKKKYFIISPNSQPKILTFFPNCYWKNYKKVWKCFPAPFLSCTPRLNCTDTKIPWPKDIFCGPFRIILQNFSLFWGLRSRKIRVSGSEFMQAAPGQGNPPYLNSKNTGPERPKYGVWMVHFCIGLGA